MTSSLSLRSVVVAVVLSFPLVACASLDSVPSAASAGGGSGGSPLAGSPSFSSDSSAAANRAPVMREVAASREASPRSELRVHEVLTCRQCR
ncbi:MAG: hypothetical protein ABI183_08455 [Polyangiaceae bacterium]